MSRTYYGYAIVFALLLVVATTGRAQDADRRLGKTLKSEPIDSRLKHTRLVAMPEREEHLDKEGGKSGARVTGSANPGETKRRTAERTRQKKTKNVVAAQQ